MNFDWQSVILSLSEAHVVLDDCVAFVEFEEKLAHCNWAVGINEQIIKASVVGQVQSHVKHSPACRIALIVHCLLTLKMHRHSALLFCECLR
jgi:hypothetical protein